MTADFNLVPCKGFASRQSFINRTTSSTTQGTLRVHSQGALEENPMVRGGILYQAQSSI